MLSGMRELALDYSAARVPVRDDLQQTHREILESLRGPGCWFRGAERVAIAAESRAALDCALCRERKAALSPGSVVGEHGRVSDLPETVVDVAHRVRVDSGRLSRAWFERALGDVEEGAYVEIVGIVALMAGIDHVCRSLGIPLFELPGPLPGEPSRYRPANLKAGIAWVPLLAPEDVTGLEADLYDGDFVPNIIRALSSVPEHARLLQRESSSHYVPMRDLLNPAVGRDLDRAQIELVAARVSALNECFY
jgi:hypothetical protein